MHILIITHYWPPEIGTSAHLVYEFGETLVKRGNQVTVVTGMPAYHMKTLPERYAGKRTYEETMGGMRVLRIRTGAVHSPSRIRRGLEHLIVAPLYAWRALDAGQVDVVYTVSPPVTMGIAAWLAAQRSGVHCCLTVQDLFPQNVIDLGLLKNRTVIRCLESLERLAYRLASAVTVHSEGNRAHVIRKGKAPGAVTAIHNWADTDVIRPAERNNSFREELGVGDDFVVSFAGTFGWSQGLEVVVEAARVLGDEPGLRFVLIGDGAERARLESLASGLTNLMFVPMQAKERYPSVLAASDACLVTLRPEVATPVVPSKLLTIMAAGRPVLATMPRDGDAPKIIEDSRCGFITAPGDAAALAEAILLLKHHPDIAQRMGVRGREYAVQNFSRTAVIPQFETVLRSLSSKSPHAVLAAMERGGGEC